MNGGSSLNNIQVHHETSHISDHDIYFLKEGNHFRLYNKLGAHLTEHNGVKGVHFAVWAPNAEAVSVMGDFNGWNTETHRLMVRDDWSGVWEGFIPNLGHSTLYKYFIKSRYNGYQVQKGDPFAFHWELPPKTASVVWDLSYQ